MKAAKQSYVNGEITAEEFRREETRINASPMESGKKGSGQRRYARNAAIKKKLMCNVLIHAIIPEGVL